jgi:hypothetical protein
VPDGFTTCIWRHTRRGYGLPGEFNSIQKVALPPWPPVKHPHDYLGPGRVTKHGPPPKPEPRKNWITVKPDPG